MDKHTSLLRIFVSYGRKKFYNIWPKSSFISRKKIEFQFDGKIPTHVNHILIVDDVITTGATLESAYHVVRKEFQGKISVVSIAHTF